MNFTLKQYDVPLLTFSASMDTSDPEIKILWHDSERETLLPLDLTLTPEGIKRWLRHRTIPRNRAYVHSLLAKCGLNLNRPMNIILVCKGLSLNDCYWIVEEGYNGTYAQNNLYENPINNVLAALAFTGYGSNNRTSLCSSPEFTTNGMLPKCWRRMSGKILLYKGGTEGASNAGFEPYSEYYASQVASEMELDAIRYNLSRWKGRLCSTCKLFTSLEYSFLPVGYVVTEGGMEAVCKYYERLGEQFTNALNDMFVFDAVICNVDRHFGNFGFLVENKTNQIVAPAPLFDHGNSLFNFAGQDCWNSEKELEAYIETLEPSAYDDFIGTAKRNMNPEHHKILKRLLDFHLKRHPRYNLPPKRLRMIEKQIQKRAGILLDV